MPSSQKASQLSPMIDSGNESNLGSNYSISNLPRPYADDEKPYRTMTDTSEFTKALANPKALSDEELYHIAGNAQEAMNAWQIEWLKLHNELTRKDEVYQRTWRGWVHPRMPMNPIDADQEKEKFWTQFERAKNPQIPKPVSRRAAAAAARRNDKRKMTALKPAPKPASKPAPKPVPKPVPKPAPKPAPPTNIQAAKALKSLNIDMVDAGEGEMGGRGQRVRKARKIFGEETIITTTNTVAPITEPQKGKRKASASAEDASIPPAKRSKPSTRATSVASVSISTSVSAPVTNASAATKRKREENRADSAAPSAKKRVIRSGSLSPFKAPVTLGRATPAPTTRRVRLHLNGPRRPLPSWLPVNTAALAEAMMNMTSEMDENGFFTAPTAQTPAAINRSRPLRTGRARKTPTPVIPATIEEEVKEEAAPVAPTISTIPTTTSTGRSRIGRPRKTPTPATFVIPDTIVEEATPSAPLPPPPPPTLPLQEAAPEAAPKAPRARAPRPKKTPTPAPAPTPPKPNAEIPLPSIEPHPPPTKKAQKANPPPKGPNKTINPTKISKSKPTPPAKKPSKKPTPTTTKTEKTTSPDPLTTTTIATPAPPAPKNAARSAAMKEVWAARRAKGTNGRKGGPPSKRTLERNEREGRRRG